MVCQVCGTASHPDALHCLRCGAALAPPGRSSSYAQGTEYELYLGRYFEAQGYSVQHNVRLTGESGATHQVDLLLTFKAPSHTDVIVVEAKAYAGSIDKDIVFKLSGVVKDLKVNRGILATTGRFVEAAKQVAEANQIDLMVIRMPPPAPPPPPPPATLSAAPEANWNGWQASPPSDNGVEAWSSSTRVSSFGSQIHIAFWLLVVSGLIAGAAFWWSNQTPSKVEVTPARGQTIQHAGTGEQLTGIAEPKDSRSVITELTPEQVVTKYYSSASERDYSTAYSLLSPRQQASRSFEEFQRGFQTTQSIAVNSAGLVPGHTDLVQVEIQTNEMSGGSVSSSRFTGTWSLVHSPSGWKLDSASIAKEVPPQAPAPTRPPPSGYLTGQWSWGELCPVATIYQDPSSNSFSWSCGEWQGLAIITGTNFRLMGSNSRLRAKCEWDGLIVDNGTKLQGQSGGCGTNVATKLSP